MAFMYGMAEGEDTGGVSLHSSTTVGGIPTAPSSSSSGNALHNDGLSFDDRSDHDETLSFSSPVSLNDLEFHHLTLNNNRAPYVKANSSRYSIPYHRGLAPVNTPIPYTPRPRERTWRDKNARAFPLFNNKLAAGGGFRPSHTWLSPEAQVEQDFLVVRNAMRRQFRSSDVAKWKLEDYIAHRAAIQASQAKQLASQVNREGKAFMSSALVIPRETQDNLRRWGVHGNFEEHGNTGRVLGQSTIWCTNWKDGKDEIAPWPTLAEMKWEGDDRAKTGVGRFLPLPRERGPSTIAWNQLAVVDQYPLDQTAKIPTMEDVYLPVDDQIEPEMEYLWSKELEKEMDAFLDL